MSLDFYVRIIGKDQTGPAVSSAKKNFDRLRDAKGRFVAGAGGVGGGGRAGRGFFGRGVGADLTIAAQGIDELSRRSRAAALAPLSTFMDVEAQMDAVAARLKPKDAVEGLEKIRAEVLRVGKDVKGATAIQGAEAAEFMAQAGQTPDEIVAMLVPVSKHSKAMRTELGRTADIVTDIAGQFQIPAAEVPKMLGQMTVGVNKANMDLETLYNAAQYAGPVMKALGNDIADTLAISGQLANVGIKGGMGGTTIKAFDKVLAPKHKRHRKAAKALGVSVSELEKEGIKTGDRLDVNRVINRIAATALERGTAKTEVVEKLKDLFGEEHLAGIAALVEQEQKAITEIRKAKAEGKTTDAKTLTQIADEIRASDASDLEAAYENATKGLKAGVEGLKSELTQASYDVGEAWAPTIKELLPTLKEGVISLADWAKNNKELVISIGKVLGVIAVAGPVITPLVLSLSALKTVVSVGSGGAGLVKGILGAARALDGKTGLVAGLGKLGVVGAAATAVIWGGIQAYDALVARGEVLEKQKEIAADEKLTDTYQKGEFRSAVAGLSEEELRAELGASTKLEDGSWSRGTEGQVIGATRSKEPGFLARWLGAESTVVQTGRARQEVLQEAVNRGVATDAQRAELIAGTVQTTLAKLGVTREENVQKVIQQELAKANLTFNVHVKKDGRVEVVASSDSGKVNTTQQLDTGVVAGS